jgi:hypothetical protein
MQVFCVCNMLVCGLCAHPCACASERARVCARVSSRAPSSSPDLPATLSPACRAGGKRHRVSAGRSARAGAQLLTRKEIAEGDIRLPRGGAPKQECRRAGALDQRRNSESRAWCRHLASAERREVRHGPRPLPVAGLRNRMACKRKSLSLKRHASRIESDKGRQLVVGRKQRQRWVGLVCLEESDA